MDPHKKWETELTQHRSKLSKIVKAPKTTPKVSLYGEIGELPIDFIIYKKQIMYLRKLLTWKTQINDITKIQLENPNKNNVVTYIYSLLTKYNNLSVEQIVLYTKNRWNKLITNKINEKANLLYLNESNKLKKLHHLNKFVKSIKLEKKLIKLQQLDAIVIFKLRTRMTNLKNNFHGK